MNRIASLPARLWAKLRAFRPTKKRILIFTALLLCAALGFFAWRRFAPRGPALPVSGELVRTARLERQTLSESITVTGTVQSGSVTNVTTSLSYPVQEILVQVGDTVRAGDVICRLDASDLEKELAQKQKLWAENKETAQKNYDRALESYNSAVTAQSEAESAYHAAGSAFSAARNTQFMRAADSVQPYQQALDAAQAAENDAGIAENNAASRLVAAETAAAGAQTAKDAAESAHTAARAALDADPANAELQAALASAEAALAASDTALACAEAESAAARQAHTAAQNVHAARTAERESAALALKTAKENSGYDALNAAYAQADEAFLRAQDTYERAVETAKQAQETLENAADALKKAGESDDVAELYERIEDCTVTAGADGTITALNATVGSSAGGASGGVLAVIQDTGHLKVAVTIDEDDIKRVQVGQEALIRSDATGDAQIAGRLSQLSLTADASGSGAGFGAQVTVTDADSGLLIGLSAKVELILSQAENVYAVPYDALETDEDGQTVVYARMPGETEFSPVPVETGLESGDRVEIRGDGLADGMEVRVSTADVAGAGGGDDLLMMDGGQVFVSDGGMYTFEAVPGGDDAAGGPGGGMPGGPGGM